MSTAAAAVVPRERLIERALALIVEDEIAPPSPAANNARLALDQWRTRSPEHAAAVREARERWNALGGMADDLRAHFDEPTPAAAPRGPSRRKLLLSVAGLLGAGVVAGRGVQWYWQQPVFQASYRTPNAQMLKVMLADAASTSDRGAGSRLDLAPQSAVDVTLYRRRRVVDMARGEVRFEVAPDAGRPFVVRTREALIEVVGTAFTVRDRGGPITVGVEHGHVRVQVLGRAGTERSGEIVDLRAGEMLEVRDGHADPVRHADTAALSAWRDGWLVFDNTPLGDALAAVNSYRNAPIVGADDRIDAMRLSGRFRTNDSAGLLDALPTILPLVAIARPDGSVRLQAR
ncbi:FecR family protein [Acidovorax cavernicola]|uniref:Iron dicitrate transport regulator FecR n=1 Tax=Acidovorax cavernicola TaxID=1675792 RepID=A0A9X8D5B1_9BURK|nr:FecR domain-containing protein [Acidovorax cavernicola]RIX80244.1 iron dicitrate transport regulator FecR [Acidovorax cavernicola]